MPFTDRSDIYVALNEAGINRAIRHVMRQRPSLFNYATARIIGQPGLWCRPIDVHPVVTARGNPLFTELPAVPVFGTKNAYALDVIAQLGNAAVDFFPVNVLSPPAELGALPAGAVAVMAELSAGLGLPSQLPAPALPAAGAASAPVILPPGAMTCFTLSAFGFGTAAFTGMPGDEHVHAQLLGFDTVAITPQALEDVIDGYVSLVAKLGILPQLAVPTVRIVKDVLGLLHVVVEPAAVGPNPAIADDQIAVLLQAKVSALPAAPLALLEHGGGVVRARTRTGPFDVVGAVSKALVSSVFGQVLAGYKATTSGTKSFGPFSVDYRVAAHAGGGSLDLTDDGAVAVKDLGITWDQLELCFGVDIPEVSVGGFCLVPMPSGCALRAPRLSLFSANPDLHFCLELGGHLHSKVSLAVRPTTRYRVDPGRTGAMNDWDAADAKVPNLWQILAQPVSIEFELVDIAATAGDLFGKALDAAIDTLLAPLPGWAKDLVRAIVGPIEELARRLLGVADHVEQWLIDLIGHGLGLFDLILKLLSDYLGSHPLAELPDPIPILAAEPSRIAVMLPVEFLGVQVTAAELIVNADLGGVP